MSGADPVAGAISRRRALLAAGAGGLASLLPAAALGRQRDDFVVVRTTAGRVRGQRDGGIARFLGIPYGVDAATTRFALPQPVRPWRGVLPALAYGPAAPQAGREPNQSEDCLRLNIWTPAPLPGPAPHRPVLVYIHGGAYNSGSGSAPLTDGARLAAHADAVVVTVNHRLNAFGYLALGRLYPDAFPDSGNAGQWDLVLALQFIAANIAAFGGDPARVILAGQSGGGAKIATLMAMPAAAGLFAAVVTMSGQQVTASGPLNASLRAAAFLDALGLAAPTPEALRAVPAARLVEALATPDPVNPAQSLYFGPVLDFRALPMHPFWPEAPALSAHIPMILGNTLDETRTLIGRGAPEMFALDWAGLDAALARHMRVDIDPRAVISLYREQYPQFSPAEVFFAATAASRSWRGQVEEADARARAGSPTWVYRLDLPAAADNGKWGAPHTADIPYLFQNHDAEGSFSARTPAAQRAGEILADAVFGLVRTGGPEHPDLPAWPRYTLPTRETLLIGEAMTIANDPRGAERALFATVPFTQWGT